MRHKLEYLKGKIPKSYPNLFTALALSFILVLSSACDSGQSASADATMDKGSSYAAKPSEIAEAAIHEITIPDGTVLSVRLLHSISSSSAHSGDEFDGELADALTIDGKEIFPKGTPILGRVVSAKRSGRLQDPGRLTLTLKAVQGRNGEWIKMTTSSFHVQGESHKKRNLTLIGGGSGVGAVIGGIAGGGKGAAIGALSGAAAGTAGAAATGEKNVTLRSERVLRFTVKNSIAILQ